MLHIAFHLHHLHHLLHWAAMHYHGRKLSGNVYYHD